MTIIPSSRSLFVDPKTGLITREWFSFLFNLKTDVDNVSSRVDILEAAFATDRAKITNIGGFAVKLLNQTAGVSVKGYLVETSSSVNFAVQLVPLEVPDCIGVFLDSGIAVGAEAWVVVAGVADVYFSGSTTRNHLARVGFAADTGEVSGQAISEAVPSSPFASDKHWSEVGHVLESRTGAGLARCVIHFN